MIVAWLSASNSVQSIATVMLGRWPTTKGTQWRSRASTSIPWLDSRRSTCLTACLVASPRAKARPCPMSATASEADTIAPIVAPASNRTRLACRSSANRVRRKRWTLANEIWLLAGIVSPPLDRSGWNRRSAHRATQSAARYPSTIIRQAASSTFVNRAPQAAFNSFAPCRTKMRGALRDAGGRNGERRQHDYAADGDRGDVSGQADDPPLSGQRAVSSRQAGASLAGAAGVPDQAPLHPDLLPASGSDRTALGVDAQAHHPQPMS